MNRYTFRAEWCPDFGEYRGKCLEFPFITQRAPKAQQAVALVAKAVERHLKTLHEEGTEAPPALTERDYSGTFIVRTSRALHTQLAI